MQDVLFSSAIPLAFKDDLERHLFYVAEEIDDFRLIVGADGIDGVQVRLGTSSADRDAVAEKIRATRARYDNRRPRPKPDRVWARDAARDFPTDTFDQMRRLGMAYRVGSGLVAVDARVMALMDGLDREITACVTRLWDAREFRYPTLVPLATMLRGGYLHSFPQLMMFVARLHRDVDTYDAAMRAPSSSSYLQHCCESDLCLPPTMCYHTYQQFADTALDEEMMAGRDGFVVTARGKSFRFESKYEKHLERLWDFTIREIVFLGTPGFAREQRRRLMQEVFALIERWQLAGYCETANDPFFVEDEVKNNSFVQRLMTLKYELRLAIGGGDTLAAASFNLHNDFFGNAFGIRLSNGEPARTACAGVGLERLAFAVLCQHGLDPAGWPAEIRRAVGDPGARQEAS
jgi:seryl-tRNA synthetase